MTLLLLIRLFASTLCNPGIPPEPSPLPAFPGAEGYGRYATGGRGGKVLVVSNLEDDGPGSLREAVKKKEKRIIVFSVAGTIHLKSALVIKGDVTIAGQTAPGGGICLADAPVKLDGDNMIIRFLRFRMGDRYQNTGKIDGAGADDALSASRKKHLIIDHCSLSWSTDEVLSVYDGDSTTLQWNIISEPLNYSYHFEKGDIDFEKHGYGGIWGGQNLSAHHNLFAHCLSRNPRFNGSRTGRPERVDYWNNVIYNWGGNSVYGGEGGSYNLLNNYYKYGPSTNKAVQSRILNPTINRKNAVQFGRFYVKGNRVDGARDISRNNWLGIHFDKGTTEEEKRAIVMDDPFAMESMTMQTAEEAFRSVLACAGAIFPFRDTLDQRIIRDVENRTGRIIDVQGGFPHGTAYELTVNAWPGLEPGQSPLDTDLDGMPDEWEKKKGLNPQDPGDAQGHQLHQGYTNIEMYINDLVEKRA